MKSYDTWGGPREREKEKETRGERKRSYDLRDAKRENGEYREEREIGLAGEKINEKIRLGVDKKKDWEKKEAENSGSRQDNYATTVRQVYECQKERGG